MTEGMYLMAAPAALRKPDRRTEATELKVELRARSDEERIYVVRVRDGFDRIVRCLEGGLVREAHNIAAAGLVVSDRRMRQLTGGPNEAA